VKSRDNARAEEGAAAPLVFGSLSCLVCRLFAAIFSSSFGFGHARLGARRSALGGHHPRGYQSPADVSWHRYLCQA
jgi:hypothetical protein